MASTTGNKDDVRKRKNTCLRAPWTDSRGLEISVHQCPRILRSAVEAVFPCQDADKLLIVPTCQHAAVDLVGVGPAVDEEKDKLLETFVRWAQLVCKSIAAQGFFADYIDPCSGLPVIHRPGNSVWGEVEAFVALLRYSFVNAGCCKVLLHPRWGSAVYPASLFTDCPVDRLVTLFASLEKE